MKVNDIQVIDKLGNLYRLVKVESKRQNPKKSDIQLEANWLKIERKRLGITQVKLQQLSGIKQPNIAAYEAGKRQPRDETIERLKAGLSRA